MLLVVNGFLAVVAFVFSFLVWQRLITPLILLAFTFLLGTGAAFMAPAWQAIVPKLVPRNELSAAISLNSMGINISRAIGPALAGVLIVSLGVASPFLLNAVSILVIIAALIWWKPPEEQPRRLPPEHVLPATLSGIRFAMNNRELQLTMARAAGFFLFASAYWAMLPLIARDVLQGGATLYGLMLGAIGAGAVLGALLLPELRKRAGPDHIVAGGALGTAIVLFLFAFAPLPALAVGASLLAGLSWIAVLSSLNVAAQTALPDWVRARGLAMFLTVFFGSMAFGSAFWGQVATATSVSTTLVIAGVGALCAIPLTWWAKLARDTNKELTPSLHWSEPYVSGDSFDEDQPAMIQITYLIAEHRKSEFTSLMKDLARSRRSNGGYHWALRYDISETDKVVETWHEPSWLNHLRHHERVSKADEQLQEQIKLCLMPNSEPAVQHFVGDALVT
jgi:predicted MFS family arabinose efflux permease